MWVLIFALIWLIFPIFFILGALFVALGIIPLCVKPDELRPPWWDWGMDEPKMEARSEVEAFMIPIVEEVEEVDIAMAESPKILPLW